MSFRLPRTLTRPLASLAVIGAITGCVLTTAPLWRAIDDTAFSMLSRADLTAPGEIVQAYQTSMSTTGSLRLRKVDSRGVTVWQTDAPANFNGGSFLSKSNSEGSVIANVYTPHVAHYSPQGNLVWAQTLGEPGAINRFVTAFRDDLAYLVSQHNGAVSVRAFSTSGDTQWTYTHPVPLQHALGVSVTRGAVVVIARDANLTRAVSLDRHGNLVGDEVLPLTTVPNELASLTHNDDEIYLAADRQLVKLDASGQPQWHRAFINEVLCADPTETNVTCYMRRAYLITSSRLDWINENGQTERQVSVAADWVRAIRKTEDGRWILSEWEHPDPEAKVPYVTLSVKHNFVVFDNAGTKLQTISLRPARWLGVSFCMGYSTCNIGYTLYADINAQPIADGRQVYAVGAGDFTSKHDYQAYISAYALK